MSGDPIFPSGSKLSNAVEGVRKQHKEDCIRRLAMITNGKHPDYINGCPKKRAPAR